MSQHSNKNLKWKAVLFCLVLCTVFSVRLQAATLTVQATLDTAVVSPDNGVALTIQRVFATADERKLPLRITALVGDTVAIELTNQLDRSVVYATGQGIHDIAPGESAEFRITSTMPTIELLQPQETTPLSRYVAGVASIVFTHGGTSTVAWQVREFESELHDGGSVESIDPNAYNPDYFTINGLTKSQLPTDAASLVTGHVHDTIYIAIVNTGLSMHSMHFHGYHAQCVAASDAAVVGWDKDTWPVQSSGWVLLRLVPDKPGMYPVHDHNLIAVTGGGKYPNGMFTLMEIQP